MRRCFRLAVLISVLTAAPAHAAEYQGKSIDGRKLDAQAYSYETGGLYDVQVQFKRNRATIYFASGSRETIRLNQENITNLGSIEGHDPGPLSIGVGRVFFGLGIADSSFDNPQSPQTRPFKGFWRISLQETELQ